jgi:hypothetical protein
MSDSLKFAPLKRLIYSEYQQQKSFIFFEAQSSTYTFGQNVYFLKISSLMVKEVS